MARLVEDLVAHARALLPKPGQAALNRRQRDLLGSAREALALSRTETNPLILAVNLRLVRLAFDRLVGRSETEDVLDALFGRFCIGK
jgi:tRNA modification GTPase